MISFAIISSIACVSYIYLGVLTLLFDTSSKINRSFAVLCTAFVLWAFGSAGQNLYAGSTYSALFDKITYTGAELYSVSALFFFLYLTGKSRKKMIPLLAAAVCCIGVLQTANWGWNLIALQFPAGFFYISHHIVVNIINFIGLAFVYCWGRKSSLRREKLQARLIITSTLGGIVISLVLDVYLGGLGYPSLTSSIPLLWMGFISYGIIRYNLMRLSPAQFGRELISGIEEAVFIIDADWKISSINNAARNLTARKEESGKVLLEDIFTCSTTLTKYLNIVISSKDKICSREEILKIATGGILPVRADFHIIADRWGDLFGILCICRPLQNLSSFINRYGLSRREAEILHHITAGCTQTDTAESLCLSVPTIKTHTAGLYNKLGISSRNELFSILRGECLDSNP